MCRAASRLLVLVGAVIVMASPVAAREGLAPCEIRPNFSGTWDLNADLSEDLHEKLSEAFKKTREEGGGPRGGGRGGMGGPMGGPPGGMGGPMGGPPGGMGGPMGGGRGPTRGADRGPGGDGPQGLAEGTDVLNIVHADPRLTITYSDGRSRLILTDGTESHGAKNAPPDSRATWRGGCRLSIETLPDRGPKTTEVFELDSSGHRLYVTTLIEFDERIAPVSAKRAYDIRQESTEPPESSSTSSRSDGL